MIEQAKRRLGGVMKPIKSALAPLQPIYDAWMMIIAAFAWVLARVTLTIVFFSVFILYSIGLWIARKDPMRRKLAPDHQTYWNNNVISNDELSEYKRLY